MRFVFALLLALGLMATAGAELPFVGDTFAVAAQQPDAQLEVDIDAGGGDAAWFTNPMWIAIGVGVIIALIALVVAASRGGGTTVIRD